MNSEQIKVAAGIFLMVLVVFYFNLSSPEGYAEIIRFDICMIALISIVGGIFIYVFRNKKP